MGLPEGKILTIDVVFHNRINSLIFNVNLKKKNGSGDTLWDKVLSNGEPCLTTP